MDSACYSSPLGPIELTASAEGITSVTFREVASGDHPLPASLSEAVSQLDEYFAGKRKMFSLRLAPEGTPFQQHVWKELLAIPYGEKRSYLDIALKLGDRNSTRAIGAANGKNPIAVIVPCHRVIGEDGKLTGYAGGLWRKEWLLDFESKHPQQKLF